MERDITTLPKRYIGSQEKKLEFDKAEKWYIHKPEKFLESENYKILQDFPIQIHKTLEHNRLDITGIDKKSKKCLQIDFSCPFDTRIERKKEEKCTNYSDLKYEIAMIWKMIQVEFVLVVIKALGIVIKYFEK